MVKDETWLTHRVIRRIEVHRDTDANVESCLNKDTRPLPPSRRTYGPWEFVTLWMVTGSFNVGGWTVGSSLISFGLNVWVSWHSVQILAQMTPNHPWHKVSDDWITTTIDVGHYHCKRLHGFYLRAWWPPGRKMAHWFLHVDEAELGSTGIHISHGTPPHAIKGIWTADCADFWNTVCY